MRKVVTGATRRGKDRRKDDELPLPQTAQQHSTQVHPTRDREEPMTSVNNNVTGQEQRKLSNDEAALQAKNYRLAKELSEVRVRHREECKHVTRLTMENMNLASRCREAMSHVAIMKKELSIQKKKAAEATSMQKKLADQLVALQSKISELSQTTRCTTEESPIHLVMSENEHNKNVTNSKDEQNPRLKIISDDAPSDFKLDSGKLKKSQSALRNPANNSSPPINLADVAAEMHRMDQILAEHQEKTGCLPKKDITSGFKIDTSNHVSQLIVNAIISQESLKSSETSSEDKHSTTVEKVDMREPSESPDADGSDEYDIISTDSGMKLKDDDSEGSNNAVESELRSEIAQVTTTPVNLVSSDDYEDANFEEDSNLSQIHIGGTKVGSDALKVLNPSALAAEGENSYTSWLNDEVNRDLSTDNSAKMKIFPYTASPKVDFPSRVAVSSRTYNEEFPEDITPSMRRPSSERFMKTESPGMSKNGKSIGQSMSSIDAFEASFNININFPDSFSPREASIAEENEMEHDGGTTKKTANDDIYNPFVTSPVREKVDKTAISIANDPRHRDFIKDSSLPLLSSRPIPESGDSDDEYDRQPLLSPKNKDTNYSDFLSSSRKSESNKDVNNFGNGIRDRAAAAYHRSSGRKGKFFDPPGRDRTSQRSQPKKFVGTNIQEKSKSSVEPLKLQDPPAFLESTITDDINTRKEHQSPSNGSVLSRFYSYGARQQLVTNDETNSRQTANSFESSVSSPTALTSASTKETNREPCDTRSGTPLYTRQPSQENGIASPRSYSSATKPDIESSSSLRNPVKLETSNSSQLHRTGADEKFKVNMVTQISTTGLFIQNSPPEKKNAVIAEQPSRPEKQGFDSARAKFDRALGLSIGTSSAATNYKESATSVVSPNSQSIRERILKLSTRDLTNGVLFRSKELSAEKLSNDFYGTQSHSVDVVSSAPTKSGSNLNSENSFFSPEFASDAVDEGDIPMVSNLSPAKLQAEEGEPVIRKNGAWHENVREVSSTVKSNIDRPEQRDSALDKPLYQRDRVPISIAPYSRTVEQESLTAENNFDDSTKDEIFEITKSTPSTVYDYAAASRFTLNASSTKQLRIVRNIGISQTSKAYRRHDPFGQQQLITGTNSDERRQSGGSL